MNFEEWWAKEQIIAGEGSMDAAEQAWDYQQDKIDDLQAQLDKAQEYIHKLEEQRWNKLFNEKDKQC